MHSAFLQNKKSAGNSMSKNPYGGEGFRKEINKTLHKMLGKSFVTFEGMEQMMMNIEKNLNIRSLTYVEDEERC